GRFSSEAARLYGVEARDVAGRLRYDDALRLDEVSARLFGGALRGGMTVRARPASGWEGGATPTAEGIDAAARLPGARRRGAARGRPAGPGPPSRGRSATTAVTPSTRRGWRACAAAGRRPSTAACDRPEGRRGRSRRGSPCRRAAARSRSPRGPCAPEPPTHA